MLTGDIRSFAPLSIKPGKSKHDLAGEYDRIAGKPGGLIAGLRKLAGLAVLGIRGVLIPERFDSWSADDPRPHLVLVQQLCSRILAAGSRRLQSLTAGR